MKGKMLMFVKILLMSLIYDLIDIFCFPNTAVKNIYEQNDHIKCFVYLNLTDTDSRSFFSFLYVNENPL